jgi:catechol 2,3-dioxygenase-like lactoylglutathione lyase family enzyme
MQAYLAYFTLLVDDYDTAIAYYTRVFGFQLVEDTPLTPEKRWVVLRPVNPQGSGFLLAKAANPEQQAAVGKQAGGRVFLFLHTRSFDHDYQWLSGQGVKVFRGPFDEPYGKVCVFEDRYGNLWDLVCPKE